MDPRASTQGIAMSEYGTQRSISPLSQPSSRHSSHLNRRFEDTQRGNGDKQYDVETTVQEAHQSMLKSSGGRD